MTRTAVVVAGALIAATVAVGATAVTQRWSGERDAAQHAPTRNPSALQRDGTELIAVFIVSSDCGASRYASLPGALARVRDSLSTRARILGMRFATIGIALDESPDSGLAFLKRYGSFDEVLAGRGWVGTGAVDFIERGLPGEMGLPQLVVFERQITAERSTLRFGNDRLIERRIGGPAILAFADQIDLAFPLEEKKTKVGGIPDS